MSKELADTNIPPYGRHFRYTHPDEVMEAVRDWVMRIDRKIAADLITNDFRRILADYFRGRGDQRLVCHRLLTACGRANRDRGGIRRDD